MPNVRAVPVGEWIDMLQTGSGRDEEPQLSSLSLGRLAFSEAPDAMVVADDQGRYVAANGAAEHLFGVEPGALVGRALAEFSPADRNVRAEFSDFIVDRERWGEFNLVRSDGSARHVEFNARANIAPGLHVSVLRDLTERDRLLEKLRSSEEQWIQVFLANPVPVAVQTFNEGCIVAANQRFLAATGYTRVELIGRQIAAIHRDPHCAAELQARLLKSGTLLNERVTIVRPDTSTLECSSSFALIEVRGERQVLMTLGIHED